jgi:hypothetical protein
MKVTQVDDGFKPVVITLDTQAEVNALWHRLNASYGSPFRKYLSDYLPRYPEVPCTELEIEEVDCNLFRELDEIVRRR